MKPTKEGQIVKFHTPLPGENPSQQYVVKEIHLDIERPKALIQALNTGLGFPPSMTVFVEDLEEVSVGTADLIGHMVTLRKPDHSEVKGKVVSAVDREINLDLAPVANGVETNVLLTVIDAEGHEHCGTLLVK